MTTLNKTSRRALASADFDRSIAGLRLLPPEILL